MRTRRRFSDRSLLAASEASRSSKSPSSAEISAAAASSGGTSLRAFDTTALMTLVNPLPFARLMTIGLYPHSCI